MVFFSTCALNGISKLCVYIKNHPFNIFPVSMRRLIVPNTGLDKFKIVEVVRNIPARMVKVVLSLFFIIHNLCDHIPVKI